MQPQHAQLSEQEEKLEETMRQVQHRVDAFRAQQETLKAQYTASKAFTSVKESMAGIFKLISDSGAALQRAQDKIATMQAPAQATDELLESGVLKDVGGGADNRAGSPRGPSWCKCAGWNAARRQGWGPIVMLDNRGGRLSSPGTRKLNADLAFLPSGRWCSITAPPPLTASREGGIE